MSAVGIANVAFGVTLALSVALPVVVKPLLMKLGIMDVPNERSSHERPVLRGLGLAVVIAMIVGFGIAAWLFFSSATGGGDAGGSGWRLALVIGLGSLAAGLLGLGEDLRGVSVRVRSVLLLIIALASPLGLLWASGGFGGASFGWVAGSLSAIALPPVATLSPIVIALLVVYAMLFISGYINVANFVDGLNGISGFHGVIAGLTFAAAGWFMGLGWLIAAGLVLAAGFGGFLPWNLSKPGAFLGDVGSYLLGGATAIISFAALINGVPVLATIGPMVICFGDVAVTLVKRVRAGNRWDEPHKEHAYQRIQQLGYTHVQASLCAAGASLVASLLGLLSIFTGLWGTLALLVAGLAVLAFYLQLPKLLPARTK